jgi:hypothetical protein
MWNLVPQCEIGWTADKRKLELNSASTQIGKQPRKVPQEKPE